MASLLGFNLWGASSWFGGPHDSTDSGHTASGGTTADPGIAVYNRQTLGGWWAIKIGNQIGVVKQTDVGPAPWTHKKFDYTYSLLPLFGFTEKNFPTGAQTYGIYLGKSVTDVSLNGHRALAKLGATSKQQSVFMQAIDVGSLERGHPIVVTPSGAIKSNDPAGTQSGSSAVAVGPDISLPNLDWIGSLLQPQNLVKIVEIIGGLMLAYIGVKQLANVGGK